MNLNAQAYDQYKRSSVETAPEKLITMLYEGLLKNIKHARKFIENKDINQAHREIINGQEILVELMASLNMDYEISKPMFLLYEYLHHQMVQANVKKDTQILNEVENFVIELRDTWQEAIIKSKSSPPAEISTGNTAGGVSNALVGASTDNTVVSHINVKG